MYLYSIHPSLIAYLTPSRSRKDQNTAQPTVTRREEAALATIWQTVVCRLHHTHHWKLIEGWNTYVMAMSTQLHGKLIR